MNTRSRLRLPVWFRPLHSLLALLLLLVVWSIAPQRLQTSQPVALSAPLSATQPDNQNQHAHGSVSTSANSGAWQADVPTDTPTPTPTPGDWELGDVFVGADGGSYRVYNGNGVYKHTIYQGIYGRTNGCIFDRNLLNLYTTNFDAAKVVGFDGFAPHSVISPIIDPNAHGTLSTESVVFGANGDLYVGNSRFLGGNGYVQRYRNGVFQEIYSNMQLGTYGTDWIDLSSDQRTMYYTSEDRTIRRYDIVSHVQLTPLPNLPSDGGQARQIILLPPGDGSGGLLVADKVNIKRLNAQGTPTATYDAGGQDNWEPIALRDVQATSFWAGDIGTGGFYRFNLASGQVEYSTNISPRAAGICVKGSYSAARPTDTPTNTHTNTPTNTPTPTITCAAGSEWCTSISPNSGIGANELHGVVAVAENDIWAVGGYGTNSQADHSLIERWTGTSWSTITAVPDVGTLNGVSAVTDNDIWAVGSNDYGVSPIIMHQDSTHATWTVVPNPTNTPVGVTSSHLNSVDYFSQDSVWAVGAYYANGYYHTLTEYWDGSTWSFVPSPDPGFNYNELFHVFVTAPGDVWAVGAYDDGTLHLGAGGAPKQKQRPNTAMVGWKTLILHWNGQSWDQIDSPNLGVGVGSELLGITGSWDNGTTSSPESAKTISSNWAVGSYLSNIPPSHTLIERITAPSAPARTTSYYENSISLGASEHYSQGCAAARRHESGIIVLDYGQPSKWGSEYGTFLIGPGVEAHISSVAGQTDSITTAAEQFAKGYDDAFNHPNPTTCPFAEGDAGLITVTISINNQFNTLTDTEYAEHALEWANMVRDVHDFVDTHLLHPDKIVVAAGIDAEPNWDDRVAPGLDSPTEKWGWKYSSANVAPYYDFGSLDGYPCRPSGYPGFPDPLPCRPGYWNINRDYMVSWGIPQAYPLPEIYKPLFAREWYMVKRWGLELNPYAPYMAFKGVMTQCDSPNCPSSNLDSTKAWPIQWLELHSDPGRGIGLSGPSSSTNISCSNGSTRGECK